MVLGMLCTSCFSLFGQGAPTNQDCQGAIPVCQNTYFTSTPYVGSGNIPNEVSSTLSCLGGGEINSVWYTFSIQSNGNLNFTLTPNIPTNDYDWALFNITGSSCSQIAVDPSLMVSCNFTGAPGSTGANGGPPPQNNPVVPVLAGETYALIVSIYSITGQGGYTLDFSQSTAQVFDNIPPRLDSVVTPVKCNSDSLQIFFSENVNCSTITAGSLQLTGPGGPYTITSITSPDCQVGSTYSARYTVKVSPNINTSGLFQLSMAMPVTDLCGNAADPVTSPALQFSIQNLTLDSIYSIQAACNQSNGSAGIVVSGGVAPLQYIWQPGGQTTSVIQNIPSGDYTVTVTDQLNCQLTDTVTVTNPIFFSVTSYQVPDTCTKGVGQAGVHISGTSGPYSVSWLSNPSNTDTVATGLVGDSTYTVQITDATGCVQLIDILVQDQLNDSLLAYFVFTPDTVELIKPLAQLTNLSQNYVNYEWIFQGDTLYEFNPQLQFSTYGIFPVLLNVYDQNGCKSYYIKDIPVISRLYFYIPNTFTANQDYKNEIFLPQGIGFDTTTYHMRIFDIWGNLIFETTDYRRGWDGTDPGGKPGQQGVYVYRVTMRDLYKIPAEYIGRVTLLR